MGPRHFTSPPCIPRRRERVQPYTECDLKTQWSKASLAIGAGTAADQGGGARLHSSSSEVPGRCYWGAGAACTICAGRGVSGLLESLTHLAQCSHPHQAWESVTEMFSGPSLGLRKGQVVVRSSRAQGRGETVPTHFIFTSLELFPILPLMGRALGSKDLKP